MGFGEAIKDGFAHYADFSGRASRSAYWWWALFAGVVWVIARLVGDLLAEGDGAAVGTILGWGTGLALLLPNWAVGVRRLHDTNRAGWWYLLGLVPIIGALALVVFLAQRGTPGPNRYGPPPPGWDPTQMPASPVPTLPTHSVAPPTAPSPLVAGTCPTCGRVLRLRLAEPGRWEKACNACGHTESAR